MTARLPDESFEQYQNRRKLDKAITDQRLKGTMIFESRSKPFFKDGKMVSRKATYRKK